MPEGVERKKLVIPSARKQGAKYLIQKKNCSERQACRLTGASRSGVRYESKPKPDEEELKRELRQAANNHKRYGYRRIHAILCRKECRINVKMVYRL